MANSKYRERPPVRDLQLKCLGLMVAAAAVLLGGVHALWGPIHVVQDAFMLAPGLLPLVLLTAWMVHRMGIVEYRLTDSHLILDSQASLVLRPVEVPLDGLIALVPREEAGAAMEREGVNQRLGAVPHYLSGHGWWLIVWQDGPMRNAAYFRPSSELLAPLQDALTQAEGAGPRQARLHMPSAEHEHRAARR